GSGQVDLLGRRRLEKMARRHDPRAPGDRVRGDHDAGGRPPSAPFPLAPELDGRRQDLPDDLIAWRQRAAGGASGYEEGEDRNTEAERHASPFCPRTPRTTNPPFPRQGLRNRIATRYKVAPWTGFCATSSPASRSRVPARSSTAPSAPRVRRTSCRWRSPCSTRVATWSPSSARTVAGCCEWTSLRARLAARSAWASPPAPSLSG